VGLTLVMPVYNASETVHKSVESFQRLSRQFRDSCLWIIDDCSTDGSFELIRKIVASNKNIRLIQNKKNCGPGLSRNRALENIRSGYIGFIDADDEIIPEGYVDALLSGQSINADFITFCGYTNRAGVLTRKYDFDRLVDDTEQLARKCIRGELDGSVIFSIFSADLIHKNLLRFPGGYFEDIAFLYSAMLLADKRLIYPELAYKKNDRSGSILNTVGKRHIDGMLGACIAVKQNVVSYGLSNYPEFEADFNYGAHGYLAQVILSVLRNGVSDAEKVSLLRYLNESIRSNDQLNALQLRSVTKKDQLVSHYIGHFRNTIRIQDEAGFMRELVTYRNQLFGCGDEN